MDAFARVVRKPRLQAMPHHVEGGDGTLRVLVLGLLYPERCGVAAKVQDSSAVRFWGHASPVTSLWFLFPLLFTG